MSWDEVMDTEELHNTFVLENVIVIIASCLLLLPSFTFSFFGQKMFIDLNLNVHKTFKMQS